MCARVAQWWSIALPRRGSRVRIPSRALKEIQKRDIRWMSSFCMFEPCRVRTVRMSTLRCRSSQANVPRTFCDVSCSQRDRKKSYPMDGSFFYVQALPGSNGSNVSAPLRSSQANVPRTFCDVSCFIVKCAGAFIYKGFRLFSITIVKGRVG